MIAEPRQSEAASPTQDGRLTGCRIARVSTVAFFLVTQLKEQVTRLADMGAQVTLICSPGSELDQLPRHERLRYVPVRIERSIRPLQDFTALIALYRIFREERFDVVHTTTPKAGLVAGLAAFLARVPVRMHTYTGQVWVTRRGPTRWLAQLADRAIGWFATQCYADSPSQRAFLVAKGIVRERKIRVIGQGSLAGVDLERFDPARFDAQARAELRATLGIQPDQRVFLFIGRIAPEKGIAELLSAFESLRAEGRPVALVLVGPLNDECGGAAVISAQDLHTRPSVHYVGYSVHPEMYMAIADVLCLPSYREGFGTVVIEAAAMRVPTLGTRIDGLIDAVEDGMSGLLVEVRSAEALANTMRRLLDEPGLRERLADAAQVRCRQLFDSDVIATAVADEYLHALGGMGRYG